MSSIEFAPKQKATEQVTAHVLWMTTGLSCEGDSVAMTAATNPSLEDIVQGIIPGMPKVVIHNQVIAYEVGQEFIQAWFDAEEGKLDPFVLIIEGSIGNEQINGEGHWSGFGVNPERAADHHQRVGRPARQQGRRRRRDRHVRDLRRHPGDEEQPDRRDGPARLPRLEVEVQGRPARDLHPGLPGAAGQHDRDAALPRAAPRRPRAGARAGRSAAAGVAVRPHRARGLQPRRLLRGGQFRHGVRQRPSLPRQARLQGARGQVQRAGARLGQRHRRLPERRRHLHGLHHARLPRQVHAVHGSGLEGQRLVERGAGSRTARCSATSATSRSRRSATSSPTWRKRGTQLTSGYQKRW